MGATMSPAQLLADGCAVLGIPIDEAAVDMFMDYLGELKAWNERVNLTAIEDERDIAVKHFLDSLSLLSVFNPPAHCTVVDVGTGAGFPGIPLKIARPDLALTLLESSRKKAGFLRHIIDRLGLTETRVAAERAEEFGRDEKNREHFCLAVSRAVASITVLSEYALPLVIKGGRFICYKAKGVRDEVSEAERSVKLLGGRIEEVAEVVVPFLSAERYVVSIAKVAPSPEIYPRRPGIPSKKPLL